MREQGATSATLLARCLLFACALLAMTLPSLAGDDLAILAGVESRQQTADIASRLRRAGYDVVALDKSVFEVSRKLLAEIERGEVGEGDGGVPKPAHLADFSAAVFAAVPKALDYKRIHVVSTEMLPIELALGSGAFVGDRVVVSHEFQSSRRVMPIPQGKRVGFGTYVIEAVMGMPDGMARADQDIVQVALALERDLPVELHFDGGQAGLLRSLGRDDVGILHIDTHGGEGGEAIQVSRAGAMLAAGALPSRVRTPVVLLFGCEGVADAAAFGSVLRQRGAEAVISSFAKFESFGMTGDPERERAVYEAFFRAIRAGEDVGTALLRMRQSALAEAAAGASKRTLTRLFFVLVGNGRLTLQLPRAGP